MALRGKKPTEIQKRLKAFFYGAAGVGKTTAAIQFPNPYLIDTEKGAENKKYVELINNNNGAVFQTCLFDELIDEVKSLLVEKHEFKTLIIDPLTILYNNLLDEAEKKVGNEFGRHYGEANKQMKQLMNLLLRLDMNVIITSHAKNEYGQGMAVIGQTFDCYKKLDYLFDLVFEIQKQGEERVAYIKKTRVEAFPEGKHFPFSYDEIANRYGRDVIEKAATQEVLASEEQVKKLNHLVDIMKWGNEVTNKWLEKTNSSSFEEMRAADIQHYIDEIEKRINKVA